MFPENQINLLESFTGSYDTKDEPTFKNSLGQNRTKPQTFEW